MRQPTNISALQEIVKPGIVISAHDGVAYADLVEENGDEFRLTQSPNIDFVYDYLKQHALLLV